MNIPTLEHEYAFAVSQQIKYDKTFRIIAVKLFMSKKAQIATIEKYCGSGSL